VCQKIDQENSGVNLAGILGRHKGRSRMLGGGERWDVGRDTPPHRRRSGEAARPLSLSREKR